ncbi:uncharacterized protein J3R85_008024 [Psidium guajava]|nr:uncharacterized protein J3R85_008024 [Psidium guajava]
MAPSSTVSVPMEVSIFSFRFGFVLLIHHRVAATTSKVGF